jgi:hypothetical protein
MDIEDASADSGESEFALEAIPSDRTPDTASNSYISEADTTSSTDFLQGGEVGTLDSSLYSLARMAAAETDGFCGATAGKLVIPDSDENVLREVNQSAEIISMLAGIEASYHHSDDSGPAAVDRLSPPASLALVEVTCQVTQQSPSLAKQDDGSMPTAAWDPFEQARKSLSRSRFDVRVIHNDGDPSDRNLI